MEEHPIEGLMETAMESLQSLVEVNTIIGDPVKVATDTIIIPVSKVGFGFAAGGSEFSPQEMQKEQDATLPFGGGSGGGVSISPIAFLIIQGDEVKIIDLQQPTHIYEKMLEYTPQVLEKIEKIIRDSRGMKQGKGKDIVEQAEVQGFEIVEHNQEADIIASIGGDGAFLQAVRKNNFRTDCIYVGLSRKNESGLYCDFDAHHAIDLLETLGQEDVEIRKFPVIRVSVNNGPQMYCLNELSIRSTIIKTIVMDVEIDDRHFETFRGDGLVIATPTGSTGYNKSTMGAVIDPLIPSFQISEVASLNNNTYRTLGSPFVLHSSRTLQLYIHQKENDHPIISMDNEAHPIRRIKNIKVDMDGTMIKTVKLKNNTYWDKVKRTFL